MGWGFLCKGIFCKLKLRSQKGMGLRASILFSSALSAYRKLPIGPSVPSSLGHMLPGWIIGPSKMQQLPRPSAHSTVLLLGTTHDVQGLEDFSKWQMFVWASCLWTSLRVLLTHLPGVGWAVLLIPVPPLCHLCGLCFSAPLNTTEHRQICKDLYENS